MEEKSSISVPKRKRTKARPKVCRGIQTYQDACDCLLRANELLCVHSRTNKPRVLLLRRLAGQLDRRITDNGIYKVEKIAHEEVPLRLSDSVLCHQVRLTILLFRCHAEI